MRHLYQLDPTYAQHHILNFTLKATALVSQALIDTYDAEKKNDEWLDRPPNIKILLKGVCLQIRGRYPGIFEGVDLTAVQYVCDAFIHSINNENVEEFRSNPNQYFTFGRRVAIQFGKIHLPKVGKVRLLDVSFCTKIENIGYVKVFKDTNNNWFIEFET